MRQQYLDDTHDTGHLSTCFFFFCFFFLSFVLTGHQEVIKFLLEKCEVPVDPKDRYRRTRIKFSSFTFTFLGSKLTMNCTGKEIKVMFVLEPSGQPSHSLLHFPQHEAKRSMPLHHKVTPHPPPPPLHQALLTIGKGEWLCSYPLCATETAVKHVQL